MIAAKIAIIKQLLVVMTALLAILQGTIMGSPLNEPVFGAVENEINNLIGIEQAEEAYFQTYGKYLQILSNNRLPHYESGTVAEKIGTNVAPNWKVHVYETPKKEWGWQAFWEDTDNFYSQGHGPEALSRAYTASKSLPINSISSTTAMNRAFFSRFRPLNFIEGSIWEWLINSAYALSSNSNSTDLEFTSSQYWSITDAAQTGLDITGDLTIAFWANFETAGATQFITGKWTETGNQRSYLVYHEGSTDLWYLYLSTDGVDSPQVNVGFTESTGTWYHMAITYLAATRATNFYINGSQQGTTKTHVATGIFNGTGAFQIGAGNTSNYFDGLIDDYRIWSRELSATEISNLYTNPCTFDDGASLQGQWLFDNDGLDQTANNNDLTNNNTATFSTTVAYTCPVGAAARKRIIIIQ